MSNNKEMIRFFTMEQFHGKQGVGSARIRAHNLIKYWDEAGLYQYGEFPDVLIYQKVYKTFDYHFAEHFENMQILDVCDPDWKDTPDIFIKETMDAMDAVVVPTKALKDYLKQMTDKPIKVIKDRFDMEEFPAKKVHSGRAKKAVWFGYSHNAGALKFAVQSLERRGIDLIVVSDEDPMPYRWAENTTEYEKRYKWVKYFHPDAYKDIQEADITIFPAYNRPMDMFKSDNKTIISYLLGLPVAKDAEELDALLDGDARNKAVDAVYDKLREEYDCKRSVEEYQKLIVGLKLRKADDGKS